MQVREMPGAAAQAARWGGAQDRAKAHAKTSDAACTSTRVDIDELTP
jgi:hypothetical protein